MKRLFAYFLILYLSINFQLLGQNINLENKFRLAQSYEQAGMYDKAVKIYLELYTQQPANFVYFDALNRTYLSLKQYDNSVKLLEIKIKENPNDINYSGLLGSTYYLMNEHEKAFAIWERSLDNNSSEFNYRTIANYAIQNRAFDKAIEILKLGEQVSRDKIIFAFDLANLYSITMKYSEASEEYCKILLLQPSQIGIIKSRIASFINQHEAINKALIVVKSFSEKYDTNSLFFDLLNFLYLQADNYLEAFNSTLIWDKLTDSKGAKVYSFAQEALNNNNFDFAKDAFNYIIKNFPATPYSASAKIGYARSLFASLNFKYEKSNSTWKEFSLIDTTGSYSYKPIIKAYQDLIKEYPENQDIISEALNYIGEIYYKKFNNIDSAKTYFQKIVQKYPLTNFSGNAFFNLAEISIIDGNLTQALDFYDKIIMYRRVSTGELNEAEFLKAKIWFWQGDIEKTLKTLSNVTKDLNQNITNDALSLMVIINTLRNDSLNLIKFANADLLVAKKMFIPASEIYLELSKSDDLFLLKNLSLFMYSQMMIAVNNYEKAIFFLENLSNNENMNIFADKSLFLLGNLYYYEFSDKQSAKIQFEKLLEIFPNSLYLDKARYYLTILQ